MCQQTSKQAVFHYDLPSGTMGWKMFFFCRRHCWIHTNTPNKLHNA